MTTLYAIIEDQQPMDGAFLSFDQLMSKLPYADHDAEVMAWDIGELTSDLSTPLRIVTEDVVKVWWDEHFGASEACSWIEAGKPAPGLAQRFYADEVGSYEARVAA